MWGLRVHMSHKRYYHPEISLKSPHMRMRGSAKVTTHLMFGLTAITATQLIPTPGMR